MPKPAAWSWQKPTMQFRTLQYAVPAKDGTGAAAELIFSVFKGDGGPVQANIDRWAGQFRGADGSPVKPETSSTEVSGLKITRVELKGSYAGMGAAAPRPGQAQSAAIVEAPGTTVFIRLLGPEATVDAARPEFDALVKGITRRSGG